MRKFLVCLFICCLSLDAQAQLKPLKVMLAENEIVNTNNTVADKNQSFLENISHFTWLYAGVEHKLDVISNVAIGSEYYEKDIRYTGDDDSYYSQFLQKLPGDSSLSQLCNGFKAIAKAQGYSKQQLLSLAAAFVQRGISYDKTKIKERKGYMQYHNRWTCFPCQTLIRQNGVCIDKAILLYAIYRELGYGASIIILSDKNHAAVGLASNQIGINNSNYLYVETTGNFAIGVIPDDFKNTNDYQLVAATTGKHY